MRRDRRFPLRNNLHSQEGLVATPVITGAVNRPVFACHTLAKGKSTFGPGLLFGVQNGEALKKPNKPQLRYKVARNHFAKKKRKKEKTTTKVLRSSQ